jgi:sulfur carrier protein
MGTSRGQCQIQVNGRRQQVPAGCSVDALLQSMQVRPQGVAVEVNRQLIPRGDHGQRRLSEGDCVEIVTLVGGG